MTKNSKKIMNDFEKLLMNSQIHELLCKFTKRPWKTTKILLKMTEYSLTQCQNW